ncbi:MAG: dephospho-CoA kinase [Gammaproteobacteria bacterium]|nr:dephospho-CoA kinase [Gammaproteobacteria bacterium]
MLRIALTGGIASGKSTVAELFETLGVPVIHTDQVARDVVAPGSEGLQSVVNAFGEVILDETGNLDRKALRQRIFTDPSARKTLESILHPLIHDHVESELQAAEHAGHDYAIVEIPLLAETGAAEKYDRVLVVDCSETEQRRRLMERDQVSEDDADAALASQASREERLALADDVIDNTDRPIESLADAVRELDGVYRQPAH